MYRAVIFDLFETLITDWGHEKYTKRKMSDDLCIPFSAFSQVWEQLHLQQYRGGITFEDSIRYVCRQCGVPAEEETIRHMTELRKKTKAACFDCLHPDILPMLRSLRERGYKLCLLSNCSGEEVETVRDSVLAPLFDECILSHETGLCKPETAIYRLAADRLGAAPADCVFIGDGGSRELYGALEAGMHPHRALWYICQMPDPIREQPEFPVLKAPSDVLRILPGKRSDSEEKRHG